MKTTTLPPIRVDPKVKKEIESVLDSGETLSSFILEAVTKTAAVRQAQQAFLDRALASERRTARSGRYVKEAVVYKRLEAILARARRKQARER